MESLGELTNLQGHLQVEEQPTPARRKQQWATQELGKAKAYLELRLAMDVEGRRPSVSTLTTRERLRKMWTHYVTQ